MKLLLDENLPKRLKQDFSEHEVYTVRDKGWSGVKNGELLNTSVNTYKVLTKLTDKVKEALSVEPLSVGPMVISENEVI